MVELDQEMGFFGAIRKTFKKGTSWWSSKKEEPSGPLPPSAGAYGVVTSSSPENNSKALLANLLANRQGTPKSSDDSGASQPGPATSTSTATLAGAASSSSAAHTTGRMSPRGSAGGGLDGIFASVTGPIVPGKTAAGVAPKPRTSLVVGKPIEETDSQPMLGKWYSRSS